MAATRLSFSYPEKMKKRLIVLAKKDSRSLSSYVQSILAKHIEDVKTKRKKKTKKVKK